MSAHERVSSQKRLHYRNFKPRTVKQMHPLARRSENEIRRAEKPQKPWMRIKVWNRESAAMLMLRNFGYSVNILAEYFGRSTSVIHKRIRQAYQLNALRYFDNRKLPSLTRLMSHCRQHDRIDKIFEAWVRWIEGEGEKPP